MLDFLHHLFGFVCGQNPDHTWAPGGVLLPCCQRCLGLYAGAGVAALLHLWLRPQLTGRFLEAHGAFLLLMAPFGFHWLPQGPVLRTITGLLFGFGVFAFLWLPLSRRFFHRAAIEAGSAIVPIAVGRVSRHTPSSMLPSCSPYAIGLLLTVGLVPLLAACGGRGTACALSALVFIGLIALAAAICGNAALALSAAVQFVRLRTQPRRPA
jgi:uncharacterized membrane protein